MSAHIWEHILWYWYIYLYICNKPVWTDIYIDWALISLIRRCPLKTRVAALLSVEPSICPCIWIFSFRLNKLMSSSCRLHLNLSIHAPHTHCLVLRGPYIHCLIISDRSGGGIHGAKRGASVHACITCGDNDVRCSFLDKANVKSGFEGCVKCVLCVK